VIVDDQQTRRCWKIVVRQRHIRQRHIRQRLTSWSALGVTFGCQRPTTVWDMSIAVLRILRSQRASSLYAAAISTLGLRTPA
jgi:hypothetical protein